jgi:uncharacterized protein (DUF433 family)
MPTVPVITEPIEFTPGVRGGEPRIARHRPKVQRVVLWHEGMGMSLVPSVAKHPGLTHADLHAALACYHVHRAEMDADLRVDKRFARNLADRKPSLTEEPAARRHAACW